MKKILKKIFSRMVFIILALALQIGWLFFVILRLGQYYAPISLTFCLLSIAVVIWIINSRGNPSIKMAWIVPIMVFPVFGGLVYLMAGGKQPRKKMRAQIARSSNKIAAHLAAQLPATESGLRRLAKTGTSAGQPEADRFDSAMDSPAATSSLHPSIPALSTSRVDAVGPTKFHPKIGQQHDPQNNEFIASSLNSAIGFQSNSLSNSPIGAAQSDLSAARLAVLASSSDVLAEISALDPHVGGQCHYLASCGFPVHRHTSAQYFRLGEEQFQAMLRELEKAEHFIFMEYFIIEEGLMWNSLLDVLMRKARSGVDVRVMFDDMGCMNTLPFRYDKYLERQGIRAIAFNPFRPVLSAVMNNRDHRKIAIVDGHTGFTGGVNLADEYINERRKYGHWKDTGVLLKGEAVWNLTLLFLEMWNAFRPTDEDLSCFQPHAFHPEPFDGDGYVQPYGDTPLDNEVVAENVYLNIVHQAKRSIDIFTPYLIIDHEMMTALCLAAKRGVRVRIVLPGIPESPVLERLAKSHYPELLDNGVEIYEYAPGFIHAKCFVCDGEIATVGTINMDYRSLYLHFECGCYFYRNSVVEKIAADVEETLRQCRQVQRRQCSRPRGIVLGFYDAILRLFAPLM